MLELSGTRQRLSLGVGVTNRPGGLERIELLAPLALTKPILETLGPPLGRCVQRVVSHLVQTVGALDAAQIVHPAFVVLPVIDRQRPHRPPLFIFVEIDPRGDHVHVFVVGVLVAHNQMRTRRKTHRLDVALGNLAPLLVCKFVGRARLITWKRRQRRMKIRRLAAFIETIPGFKFLHELAGTLTDDVAAKNNRPFIRTHHIRKELAPGRVLRNLLNHRAPSPPSMPIKSARSLRTSARVCSVTRAAPAISRIASPPSAGF